jgi:N-acyl-D-aspartate/D-glutamate deacylase
MGNDIVIRNGLIADGLGGDPVIGDVGIAGDRITEVGDVEGRGAREIDADGRLVTPGFVDIHTHLDAQIGWDPLATSSSWHGVTSLALGSCGVSFAPVRPGDERYLAELMESVEDIPADSIMSGLDWSWQTYGDFLDYVDGRPKGVNVGGFLGHCALRYYVMGERSLDEAPATDDDVAAMCKLVDEALGRGALGFSSSRYAEHKVPDGRLVPGSYADDRELLAFAEVMGRHGHGTFDVIPWFISDASRFESELSLLERFQEVSGRPVTFTLVQNAASGDLHERVLGAVADARARGVGLYPQTTVRSVGVIFSTGHQTPFSLAPAWQELHQLPADERLAALRDPARRARLVADGEAHPPYFPPETLFVLPPGAARYDNRPEASLAAHAAARGVSVAEAFVQLADERDGELVVVWPALNDDLDAVAAMVASPVTVLGLADAGAHVGMILDASQPTYYLSHFARDTGAVTVGEAIRRLTAEPAALLGIRDRGVLAPGAYADLNVIDLDGLGLPLPTYVRDMPAGAGRYVQRSEGYACTLVNGTVLMEDGEHTGALPGRLLRGGS